MNFVDERAFMLSASDKTKIMTTASNEQPKPIFLKKSIEKIRGVACNIVLLIPRHVDLNRIWLGLLDRFEIRKRNFYSPTPVE